MNDGFEYHKPATIKEAIKLMGKYGETAKVIASGVSLVILLREKLIQPEHLVSLSGLKELDFIRIDGNGELRIGALATHRSIEKNPEIIKNFGVLAEMETELGSVQVRNRGTIGGNLCHAEPLSDPPTVIAALRGTVVLQGLKGERRLLVEDFIKDYYETDLKPGEILIEVRIPKLPPNTGCSYLKLTGRKGMDLPFVGVAVSITLDKSKKVCEGIRIVLGAVATRPVHAEASEKLLRGKNIAEISDGLAVEAGKLAMAGAEPIPDVRCSAQYKRKMVGVMVKRAINEAIKRAS